MMRIRASPVPALKSYVCCFEQRQVNLGGGAVIYPIAARPEQLLEFYLQQPYLVHFCESGSRERAPRSAIVGPFTYRRVELVLHGRYEVFTIQFQPAGFHGLFGVPMTAIVDQACEARAVLGRSISTLEDQLADAIDFGERVRIASAFLLARITQPPDGVGTIANHLLRNRGAIAVRGAAARAGLSPRQFERRFVRQIGIAPKRYARIVRFHSALSAKLTDPGRTWTDIACALGYFDQMHLVHDFQQFCGESPAVFLARYANASTRWA